ncbi:MAG TPA: GNAT family N-acetyltransferase [Gemmatimonadaceae bacterium]|nr:GNAT family N-acetyltransferase [Gemmatimonadaceae bacterium]
MADSLLIEHVPSSALTPAVAAAVRDLCDAAYGEATDSLFAALGPGDHLLALVGGELVSHLMWVTRWLEPRGLRRLRTAYVEMVATAPEAQGRGYATALLERFPPLVASYELAALAPATENLYARLGWCFWRGPLSTRREGRLEATPEERVMILPLPRTPLLDLDAPLSVEWRPGEVW